MDKTYLEEQYKLAVSDFRVAKNENEQWKARSEMSRIERTAAVVYGFAFADHLHELAKM